MGAGVGASHDAAKSGDERDLASATAELERALKEEGWLS
jgi:hypothetical protein